MNISVEKRRVDSVDILRAIGILLMVMGHVGFGGVFDRYIHSFHMPVFFLISGFLFNSKSSVSLGKIVLNRAKRLLIPYVFYAVLNYIFWLVLKKEGIVWYVPLLRAVTYNTQGLPICGALWFLTAMFLAETYYILFDRIIKNSIARTIIVISISVIASFLQTNTSVRLPLTIDTAVVCMGFLELGRVLKNVDRSKIATAIKRKKSVLLLLGLLLLVGNAALSFVNDYVNIKSGWFGFVPLFWINALIGSAAYLVMAIWFDSIAKESNILKKMLVNIGRKSMIFLGFNQLVILLFSKAYALPELPQNIYIKGAVIFIATTATLYLISFLVGLIKSKSIKRIFGV